MKNPIFYGLVAVSLVVSSAANAEVPTKPSYANTVKASQEKKSVIKQEEISKSETAEEKNARAMLAEETKDKKKSNNVLNSIKSGRLAESNKHITE